MYNSLIDQAKENSDLFATVHKIRNINRMVQGVYVNLALIANDKNFIYSFEAKDSIIIFLDIIQFKGFP